jgi:flagella basal body P-ring formation protein FlgA
MGIFIGLPQSTQAAADEPARVMLYSKANVSGESIRLGQIADIQTDNDRFMEALRTVEVGRSPLPGKSLHLHPNQVKLGLKKKNIDLKDCRIIAAGPVKVTRNHATVSTERIKKAVVEFISSHMPWDSTQMKIRPIKYSQAHIVPPGSVELQVTAPKHTDWLGPVPFTVGIMVGGQSIKRITVPAYIEVQQSVVLAAKPLGRNQPIANSDIKIKKMNLTRVPANAVLSADQVIGQRANRSIAVNTILRMDQIDMPPLVRRGDLVQVLAESKVFKITTQAVAKENGAMGDRIRLMNLRSKKDLYGVVLDAQTVKVEF